MFRVKAALVILVLCAIGVNIAAAKDSDIQNLLKGVEEKAVEIQVLKDTLAGDDVNIRHVLFNRIIKLKRPDLVDLAINSALDSNDKVLRSMALWQIIERRSEIVFTFGPKESYDDQAQWKKHQNEWGGQHSFEIMAKYPEKRCANTYGSNSTGCRSDNSITVSGEVLSFKHDKYSGVLRMNEEGTAMIGVADFVNEKAHVFWQLR